MHPFCYKSIYATSTVKYRFNTDFKFHYCLSAFCVLKSAWHLCSNNYIAVLYKWLFIVRTLQFSIYYCITCVYCNTPLHILYMYEHLRNVIYGRLILTKLQKVEAGWRWMTINRSKWSLRATLSLLYPLWREQSDFLIT